MNAIRNHRQWAVRTVVAVAFASLALAASSLQTGSTPPDAMVAEVVADLLDTIEELALHGARWLDESPAASGRV